MNNYFDYVGYLQKELGDNFIVSDTLQMDVDNTDITQVIVNQMAGGLSREMLSLPYQINVYTDNPVQMLDIITKFGMDHYDTTIVAMTEYEEGKYRRSVVRQTYATPSVMEKNFQIGNTKYCRITFFANLQITFNINDVLRIEIDGEDQEFINGSVAYAVEPHIERVSGEQLSSSKKTTATTSLNFTMLNKTTLFGRKLAQIRQGKLDGNTPFKVTLQMLDETIEEYNMIITSNSMPFEKGKMSSLNITMSYTKGA